MRVRVRVCVSMCACVRVCMCESESESERRAESWRNSLHLRHQICMHTDFASALVTLSVGEGLIKQLDPSFDVVGGALVWHWCGQAP